MSRIRAFWVISALRLCCIYALLSRIRFCRQYALILVCFVQTFTQTLRILLRFCADICPKNWSLRPLVQLFTHSENSKHQTRYEKIRAGKLTCPLFLGCLPLVLPFLAQPFQALQSTYEYDRYMG